MPIYMQYGDIKGWSTDGVHAGWIPLDSVQLGSATGQGKMARELQCTRPVDGSSPALFRESLHGGGAKVTIEFVKDGAGSTPYLIIKLTGTLISSYSVAKAGQTPSEQLSFNFTKIEFNVKSAAPEDSRN
jgi:type VI secretion system secreted protein Hcp